MALIQPVRAPTGIDCSAAPPHSIPLVHPLQLCVAGISDGAAIAGRSCRASKFDSWARPAGCRIAEVRAGQKWPSQVQSSPRCTGTDRQTIRPSATRAGLNPPVAPAASMRPCARTAASLGPLAALGYPSVCHPATQCLEHSLWNSTHPLFLFLDLPIAPWFAFCAQPGVDFCGV